MDLEKWKARVEIARSEGGVVQALRAFLAEWPDSDFQALPETCRPMCVANGEDVAHWAYILASAHVVSFASGREAQLLLAMSSVFTQASSRLAILALPRVATAHLFVDQPAGR
jgi:hypothetical protein